MARRRRVLGKGGEVVLSFSTGKNQKKSIPAYFEFVIFGEVSVDILF